MRLFNKDRRWWGRPRTGAGLLGLLAAVLLLAACKKATSLDDSLPTPASVNRLAFYTDTVTVRTSTVLVDSIASSTQANLLTGRYADPLLGIVSARSYAEFNLDAELVPDATQVYDSLVLVLTSDTYRYGDTTRVQQVEVHQLTDALRTTKPYYTKDDVAYGAAVLGRRSFRGTKQQKTLRVRLNPLGTTLWAAGQAGQLATQDQLARYLHGLALLPGAADDAAVVRWASTPVLMLYHHALNDPATVLSYTFTAGPANPHFYHLEANRTGTALAALNKPGQAISSTATGNRTFLQAGLGLYTKIELPYLRGFSQYGTTLVLNSAALQMSVPTSTENKLLPLPVTLNAQLVDRNNRPLTVIQSDVAPRRTTSARTNLEQDSYTVNLLTYVQQVLAGTINNDGIVLNPTVLNTSQIPALNVQFNVNRAVLGNTVSPDAQLQLKVYYTRVVQ